MENNRIFPRQPVEPTGRPFGINPPPVVQTVSPNTDRIAGGVAVTITGNYFQTGATVKFGTTAATGVVVVNATTITCNAPAGAIGVVSITVTNPNGSAGTLANAFTYISTVVTAVDPPSGSRLGGTGVIITGKNFVTGSTITFGGNPATSVVFINDTEFTCVTPAGTAGAVVDIVVTEPLGASGTLFQAFLYVSVVINPGQPFPYDGAPTSPNTQPPTGSFTENQDGIRWAPVVSIRAGLGNTPNICTYTVDGSATPPALNSDVSFVLNGILKFAGTITGVESSYEDATQNRVYVVTAVDYTWQLNRFHPTGRYTDKLPSEIIRDLVSRFAPGFSVGYVSNAIDLNGPISLKLDGLSDFATVLTDVCRNAGDTHFKVDYYKNVRVFEATDPFRAAPSPLVDGLSSLWNDPPPKVTADLTQLRNKVTVVGRGTTSTSNPLKLVNQPGLPGYDPTLGSYDITAFVQSTICVGSIDGFAGITDGGGTILVDGLPLRYIYAIPFLSTGVSSVTESAVGVGDVQTPNIVIDYSDSDTTINARKILVPVNYHAGPNSEGTYLAWPDGLSVQPMVVEEDTASIGLYGIHEFTISDSNLSGFKDLIARAKADLKKFSLPLYKIDYTTDDDVTMPGASLRADLSSPLIHANLVIQTVTTVHDEFGIRHEVTADSAAKYDFNDLLLDLDKPVVMPDVVGLVDTAVNRAVSHIPTPSGTTLQVAQVVLTGAQVASLNTVPVQIVGSAGAGVIIIPLGVSFFSSVTSPQSIAQKPSIVYSGRSNFLATASANWNNVTGQETQSFGAIQGVDGLQNGRLAGLGLAVTAGNSGGGAGVGTYIVTVVFTTVQSTT